MRQLLLSVCVLIGLCGFENSVLRGDEPVPPNLMEDRTPEIDPDRLIAVTVNDEKTGVREIEVPWYYEMLHRAEQFELSELTQAAEDFQQKRAKFYPQLAKNPDVEFPAFVDLFKNPDEYKGKLVTLTGWSRRIVEYPATENKHGIETLYEIWLYTDDSQRNPAVVICTSLPEGIPVGEEIVEGITVTGYFFKMFGYTAQDTTRVAPLILAGNKVQWDPPNIEKSELPLWVILLSIFVVLGLILGIWWTMRTERRFSRQIQQRKVEESEFDFTDL